MLLVGQRLDGEVRLHEPVVREDFSRHKRDVIDDVIKESRVPLLDEVLLDLAEEGNDVRPGERLHIVHCRCLSVRLGVEGGVDHFDFNGDVADSSLDFIVGHAVDSWLTQQGLNAVHTRARVDYVVECTALGEVMLPLLTFQSHGHRGTVVPFHQSFDFLSYIRVQFGAIPRQGVSVVVGFR